MATKIGSSYEDTLFGTFQDDYIYGYGDDDLLYGRAGNDRIYGDSGPSEVPTGIAGDDTIKGGLGNDRIYGEDANDSLLGGSGNDSVYGGRGNDILKGGEGNDFLSGGQLGNQIDIDYLTGGSGSDVFAFGSYHGNAYSVGGNSDYAVVTDFNSGQDTVQLDLGNYSFGSSPIAGISGTAIYQDSELIGILEGVSSHGLVFEDSTFTTTVKGFSLGFEFG